MNRNGINNINGIVKFEFTYQSLSADVSNLSWADLNLSENTILVLPSSEDGFSQRFWVRAIDAIGNTKGDTTVVYFDASSPSIGLPIMDYNVENGRYNFSSKQVFTNKKMWLSFVSKDDHSGVPLVTLKIVTQSGEIKYEHRYKDADLIVSASDCQNIVECYCSQADRNKCYMSTLRLEIDNCWMGVAINATTTDIYKLEITSYNGAMLSRKTIKEIVRVTDLSGIQELDVQETVGTTVDIQETRNVIYSNGSTICVFKRDIKGLPSSPFYIVITSDYYKMPDDAKFVSGKWFAQDKIHPLDFFECTTETSETFIVENVIEILLLDDFQAEDDVIVISEDSYYACITKVCIRSDMNDVTLQGEVDMD
ncbi:unnamed protein product [Mytilus coruscus]|uniref:Uncharacterized protein n=1 Tax=Mytilus coruscus TaxID=42192 RepID=A0A6J8D2K1_MYTCO|nr:unnamed protein product [Mytilus coruscus]